MIMKLGPGGNFFIYSHTDPKKTDVKQFAIQH